MANPSFSDARLRIDQLEWRSQQPSSCKHSSVIGHSIKYIERRGERKRVALLPDSPGPSACPAAIGGRSLALRGATAGMQFPTFNLSTDTYDPLAARRAAKFLASTSPLAKRAATAHQHELAQFERESAIVSTAKAMSAPSRDALEASAAAAELVERLTITNQRK